MPAFSFTEFYQRNRRIVIWAILFGILWLLRDFFALVLLTFVLAIIALPISEYANRRLRLPRWAALPIVYVLFLLLLATFVRFVVPSVVSELNRTVENLPGVELRLVELKNRFVERYPGLRQPLTGFMRSALPDDVAGETDRRLDQERARLAISEADVAAADASEIAPTGTLAEYFNRRDQLYLNALMTEQFTQVREYAPAIVNTLYRATATVLLALLFSFLILVDLRSIQRGVAQLKTSRIGDFYDEAAQPIVRLGMLLVRALQAQASIALANTVLTLIGLLLLGIPLVAMLSMLVLVCSFIPVLGVFISTTPIALVALNDGGLKLSVAAIGMVILIHMVEAYLLNPTIYGRHLKLHPVLTLVILYVGYHLFGPWGLILGVPVTRYFIHDVLGVPSPDRVPPRARKR
jgi:predicted PurR-regulated permease PerM